jgi:hypothetical protein
LKAAVALAGQPCRDRAAAVETLGGGWVGEEALAIGIYAALSAESFVEAIQIATNHSGDSDSTALAAAAEGYFCGEVTVSAFKAVLKLHYSKFEDFIRLSKRERSVVRGLMDVDQYAKPIYPWQGEMALLDEEWAGCLGIASGYEAVFRAR